jgi:hypothetical protein
MSEMMQALADAAARGVEVTVITNAHSQPELRFKWTFKEYRDGAIGKFKGAGLEAKVFDMDGDASEWSVRRGKEVLAEGSTYECHTFYHFDACLLAAEDALMTIARGRLAAIRALSPQKESGN